jgi:hypothetical protein
MLLNTRTYNTDRVQPDSVSYAGPANSLTTKDTLEFKRVYPKPVTGFAGVARPQAKLTKTVTVTNGSVSESHDAIITISGSLPVGMAAADVDGLLADMASLLGSADGKSLFKALDINA